jgi:hypothetical protein
MLELRNKLGRVGGWHNGYQSEKEDIKIVSIQFTSIIKSFVFKNQPAHTTRDKHSTYLN